MERGDLSSILARWTGPDIAEGNQDTIVLKIGQLVLAFLVIIGIFGIALAVFGIEFIYSKMKKGDVKELAAKNSMRKVVAAKKIQNILLAKTKRRRGHIASTGQRKGWEYER